MLRNDSRALISLRTWRAIASSVSVRERFSKKPMESATESAHSSIMFFPPTVTPSASGRSLLPWQPVHSETDMNRSSILAR